MILVTGASRGLGRAIAERLHTSGMQILAVSRQPTTEHWETTQGDVGDFGQMKSLYVSLLERKATVSALINTAGIASMNLTLTTPVPTAERLLRTNFLGTFITNQVFTPLLIRNGGGSIVNFSSIAASLALSGEAVYAGTKAAVEVFSTSFAREVSPFKVRVNCISPGPIQTDLIRGVPQEAINKLVERQVIRNKFSESDVANIVELLLDPKAASISGQVIHVGGV